MPKPSSSAQILLAWEDPESWMPLLTRFLRRRLHPGTVRAWRDRPDLNDLDDDDLEWKTLLADGLKTDFEATLSTFADRLGSLDVQTYHGCRPVDLRPYFRSGIRLASVADRMRSLQRTMVKLKLPVLRQKRILEGVCRKEAQPDIDLGKVFLAIDQRNLLEFAGHYLLLGSEWQAGRLGMDTFEALRQLGTPTLFRVRLPMGWVAAAARTELAEQLFREWTRLTALNSSSVRSLDFTFVVRRTIPAENVLGHTHPAKIRDYHSGGIEQENTRLTCRFCNANDAGPARRRAAYKS